MGHHSIPKLKSPPSQKPLHRASKIRRRRLDCQCGCTIYFKVECASYGFSHRGPHYCPSINYWRLLLGTFKKSPLVQSQQPHNNNITPILSNMQSTNPVQPQPEESIGSSPMLSQFPGLDDIEDIFRGCLASPISVLDL
ncbi:hypothetical protein RHMOL_Rhmol01G0165300 [Rhododendron molle]|uniref:Uncharacterized protein n=1 Tax=Rhododendron molle TaxID=49168 RepID=A0ACC0Q560_RHOML|nr:hypothetical protein RHMOL_Rhmol01G0165300 [Rhododendron molle]